MGAILKTYKRLLFAHLITQRKKSMPFDFWLRSPCGCRVGFNPPRCCLRISFEFEKSLEEYSPVCGLIESSYKLVVIGFMISRHGGLPEKEITNMTHAHLCFFSLHLFVTKGKDKNVWEHAGENLELLNIFHSSFL